MKEQTLLEMKNKIESLTRLMQHMFNETTQLREIGIGTLETLKLMTGYEDAIEKLKVKMEEEAKEKKKAEQNGTTK